MARTRRRSSMSKTRKHKKRGNSRRVGCKYMRRRGGATMGNAPTYSDANTKVHDNIFSNPNYK